MPLESPEKNRDSMPGLTAGAIGLADEVASDGRDGQHLSTLHTRSAGEVTVQLRHGRDTLWLFVTKGDEKDRGGGFALRTAHAPGMPLELATSDEDDGSIIVRASSALGEYQVRLHVPDPKVSLLRCTVRLTPSEDLLLPFLPRDLYPVDADGNPAGTKGKVHAAQRGLNSGLLYLTLAEPEFGTLLYFQNLTALNDFFLATDTRPDGVVGGQWPELGYQPPTNPNAPSPPTRPLPKGKEVVLSDAFLHLSSRMPDDPRQSSRLFLNLLAGIYPHLERPETTYHDWLQKAKDTLRDLDKSPKATESHYGHRYVHPYTESEHPDAMSQMRTGISAWQYAGWKGSEPATAKRAAALADELFRGMPRFYDKKLKTLRRYLPDVGEDKDADEVDSWYLYHPLINLGRLARDGDEKAKALFLNALEYGIKVGQHFGYLWPIQFNVQNLEIIKATRKEGEPGQSDVGGLYAYVMVLAWELTEDYRYLNEACQAMQAIKDMEFELAYQMNLCGWGSNACVRLWRITEDAFYREQALVFLANYMYNCVIWDSRLGNAAHYQNFFGATCLHDGPYMAIYECFESFEAFEEYLSLGQDDVPDSVRLLLSEYNKYTLDRAWYYYPSELPEEALATEIRNGHIDRNLAFPLEDVYTDGQPAGQVGQEIYGSGAALTFCARAYHRTDNMPFLLFCEYPLSELEETEENSLTLEVRGVDGFDCKMRLIPRESKTLPSINLYQEDQTIKPRRLLRGKVTEGGHCEFTVPANRRLFLRWDRQER